MKKYTTFLIVLLATTLLAASCKKDKPQDNRTELEKLPAITQIGANTFGCLVDGKAWLPNGSKPQNGGPNIVIDVDPTFQTGLFRIDAIKYNDSDVKAIEVRTVVKKKNSEIHISDNGIGMSPKTVSLMFEKFYRDHAINKSDSPANGLGLGLFYTKQCIKAHGWRIEVISKEKKGSEFIIFMPAENL